MPGKFFNLASFRPDGQSARVFLTVHGEIEISPGLRPDTFSAIAPWSELSKIEGLGLSGLRGSVELWYAQDPGSGSSPDVELQGWFIVDARPVIIGAQPGEAENSVKTYQLALADHRHAFVEPRGARLTEGLINPEPLPTGASSGALMSNLQMITAILTAMNYPQPDGTPTPPDPSAIPATVDLVPPARQLEWEGAHAPSELALVLEHCAHEYVPTNDGFGRIIKPGDGDEPTFPGIVVSDVVGSSVDRRPRRVIIFSGPTSSVRTYGSAGSVPAWSFVAQDSGDQNRWKSLDQLSNLGGNALTALRTGFSVISDDEIADHYKQQLYKAIRLDVDAFPPGKCAILREVLDPQNGPQGQPSITLSCAQQVRGGGWENSTVTLRARNIIANEGVIVFDDRLGTVDAGHQATLEPTFTPSASLKPTFTVEEWDADADRKKFAVFGFELTESGQLADMDDTDALHSLQGFRPDTAIYSAPELRLVRLVAAGQDNALSLRNTARAYARQLITVAGRPTRTVELKGFQPVQLQPHISGISYKVREARMKVTIDGWHLPRPPALGSGGGDVQLAFSGSPAKQTSRHAQAAKRRASTPAMNLAATGQKPPFSPTHVFSQAERGYRPILVQIVAPVSGQLGKYTAKTLSSKLNYAASGTLQISDLGQVASAVDCELWFTGDLGGTLPGGLKIGDIILAHTAGPKSDGKLLAVACGPKMKQKSVVTGVACVNGAISVTSETIWVLDV